MSKASVLRELQAAGFDVPAFVVIPAKLFDDFLACVSGQPSTEAILRTPVPDPLAGKLLELVKPLPAGQLAVRSSMAGEDSALHSFAGQLDSVLNVQGTETLLSAIKTCWASAYGERAQAYRRQHGIPDQKPIMEVIVQAMVPAQVSGVAFTADPVARDPRWMMISVTEGLGEGLVQGQVAGETFRVNRSTGDIEGYAEALKPEDIARLVSICRSIEELFGEPQDIEFAMAGGGLFILQARPITIPIFTEHMLWDNSNITESYSGVTTPLTFSVIRGAYAQVYRQFLTLMGVRRMDESVLRNLLGFYNGQVYYQLLNWYKALSWLPAFEQNRRFMEQMMGVKQSAGSDTARSGRPLTLVTWGLRMFGLHLTNSRRVHAFLSQFNAVLGEYQAKDFAKMSPHQLRLAYLDLERRVLGQWHAPILSDFFAMIFFGILRRLSERWLTPDSALHNDLLAGGGGMESIAPAARVQELAHIVRSDVKLQSAFDLEPHETLCLLRTQEDFVQFCGQLDGYLRLYGDRCINELKLEEPNLRDDPLPLIRMIGAAARHPVEMPVDSTVRAKAEVQVAGLPVLRRIAFQWVLKNARRYIRNRENLRFARSRLFGLLRGIFNSLGNQWARTGILDQATDIYYLNVAEIWDFVEGTAVSQELRALVALRRAEYQRHKVSAAPLPDRFETFGIPYLDTPRDLLAHQQTGSNILQGVGCCSGTVRGIARLVRSPNEISDLGGQILVAARTDPGWVFLYPSASGILVERGSPLSHSAIVARELGKPIVVNIPQLTSRIKSGDKLEMDGGTGIVTLLGS
jgi:rifampicin phosphotransferase